jgi:hypothetical protein
MKLSEELQDFMLFILFGHGTGEMVHNKVQKDINTIENEYVKEYFTNYVVSFNNKKGEKDPVDHTLLKMSEWVINDSIIIIICRYNSLIVECFVYSRYKSINKEYSVNLVGNYSFKNSVKFYIKNKRNNPQLICPKEYTSNPAIDYSIALFYILDPNLFSPKWESIAKKILF